MPKSKQKNLHVFMFELERALNCTNLNIVDLSLSNVNMPDSVGEIIAGRYQHNIKVYLSVSRYGRGFSAMVLDRTPDE